MVVIQERMTLLVVEAVGMAGANALASRSWGT